MSAGCSLRTQSYLPPPHSQKKSSFEPGGSSEAAHSERQVPLCGFRCGGNKSRTSLVFFPLVQVRGNTSQYCFLKIQIAGGGGRDTRPRNGRIYQGVCPLLDSAFKSSKNTLFVKEHSLVSSASLVNPSLLGR